MLVIRRKNIVIGLLVILLVITGYLNFVYNQNNIPAVQSPSPEEEEAPSSGRITVREGGTGNDTASEDLAMPVSAGAANFFIDYRFEREITRNKEVAYIKLILEQPGSDPVMIEEAQGQLLEITKNMEQEMVIETLIKAKGFRDVVAIIHRNNVSIIVDKPELAPEEVAQILSIVVNQSGQRPENIKIIPK